jgi:peptidoglycan/LPS O-acetylase OafA/YrhL
VNSNPAISTDSSTGAAKQPAAESAKLLRLPSLDGWRALSILMVLGNHSTYLANFPAVLNPFFTRWFTGDLGVRCFFVISGFLITWLMLGEHDSHGRVSLRHFYIRRALRILPVYFAFIGVLACLSMFTPFRQTLTDWIGNLTFTTNFVDTKGPSAHLWSLAVEEQFYLFWPVMLVGFSLAKKPQVAFWFLSVPLVIAPICRAITYLKSYPPSLHYAFTHFSFFNYFDCLAIGCLCAFLLRHQRGPVEAGLCSRPKTTAAIGLALVLLPLLLARLGLPGRASAASWASFQAIGFAVLLLQSILQPQLVFYRLLNWSWIRHLGVLSYSIYIWQQIFWMSPATYGLTSAWWLAFPGWLLAALATAHLSYFCLERPLFRLRSHFR